LHCWAVDLETPHIESVLQCLGFTVEVGLCLHCIALLSP
jgi:hypothetical protein